GGYVSFGQGGCKITGKGTIKTGKLEFKHVYFVKDLKYNLFSVSQICDNKNSVLFTDLECIVLGRDFKLLDDANVLLRTPRQHNMYSINLNNIVPHKDLTCLVAKASADEGMLWHMSLGHLNFKTMNMLVRHNLVRGLRSKCFENDHTCTAGLKGKQHKASYKSKLVNSVTKPLHTLHMDLFGPTSVSSISHKWYCLVVTDDFSMFTRTFFLKTKDETNGILRKFITEIENLKDLKVKIIRCDNRGEFRNKEMDDFCLQKGIKREFSNARTPQQNGVAKRRNRTLIEAARTMLADDKLPEEGIDYDEVFAPVARIEAIRLFLAYASFMGFTVYQMDVKSAFLYGTIDEEVYVMQPLGFQDPEFPAGVYKVEKAMYGLHQAPRAREFEALMHEKFQMSAMDVRSANTPMDKENPWGKLELEKMHQVTPKECHLHVVKRIFRYLKGHPKLGLWYPKESPFALVAYSDSDYGGATQDRKSTTGGCQFLGRRLISSQCKKQTIVDTSATEAEYVAAASCCGQVLWIQNQLLNYGLSMSCEALSREIPSSILHLYALTFKPTVYVSHIRQFWSTARIETTEEGTKILATIDGILRTVTESSLRRNLKLKDEEGISSLSDAELFENLTLMGYNISPNQKFTFQKATNRVYNFSKMIFDGMVKNVNIKILMYPRQYTRRARIAQSSALPPVVDEPASPLRDARVKLLEDGEGGGADRSGDDAPIKGRRLDKREEAAEKGSNDTKEMINVLTSIDAATVLSSGVAEVPTGSDVVPTAGLIFATATVIMIDGLDRSNEIVTKYLHEYHQFAIELPLERRIKLISDLVRYQDNYANVHKYQNQQRKPLTKKQQREFYTSVLRNQAGWKAKDFKGTKLEEKKENFDSVWKQIHDFIPIGSKEEAERFKWKGIRFEQESVKKLNTSEEVKASEEVLEEKVKEMMQLVPIEEVYVEALQVKHLIIDWKHLDMEDLNKLWTLVKESLNIRPASSDKEMELWVELKRLYKPDVEDQLWTHTQNMMHAPVEWKLEGLPFEEGFGDCDDLIQASSGKLLSDGK
nr:putative ribonuclease H-like domain-containing protein [Tanacetum cinerariifolium]